MSATVKGAAFLVAITAALALWATMLAPPLLAPLGDPAVHVAGIDFNRLSMAYLPWAIGLYLGGVTGLLVLRARGTVSVRTLVALLFVGAGFLAGAKVQYRLETLTFGEAIQLSPAAVFEPGMRMPLGLLLGGLLGCGWAFVLRAPWRETGDAFAVAMSVMIPVGRIACLIGGCCMGRPCGRWIAWLCPAYPPGTEVYAGQLERGEIVPLSPVSLPTHPLPLYFAAASLATLAVLLWLLRQRAAPGALLAAFCILRPLAKLGLEPLRAEPRPGPLMIAIPMTVLVCTSIVLLAHWVRREAAAVTEAAVTNTSVPVRARP